VLLLRVAERLKPPPLRLFKPETQFRQTGRRKTLVRK
jgi:hypothetical protein